MTAWIIADGDARNYELDRTATEDVFRIAAGMADRIRQEAEAAGEYEDELAEMVEERAEPDASIDYGPPYSGFLTVQCSKCGEVRSFCAKKPITHSPCKACGNVTKLREMKPLYLRCRDCDAEFKYKTNITEDWTTMNCLRCGREIGVALNSRGTAYVTRIQPAGRRNDQEQRTRARGYNRNEF